MDRGLLRTIIALTLLWAVALGLLFAMHPVAGPLAYLPGSGRVAHEPTRYGVVPAAIDKSDDADNGTADDDAP